MTFLSHPVASIESKLQFGMICTLTAIWVKPKMLHLHWNQCADFLQWWYISSNYCQYILSIYVIIFVFLDIIYKARNSAWWHWEFYTESQIWKCRDSFTCPSLSFPHLPHVPYWCSDWSIWICCWVYRFAHKACLKHIILTSYKIYGIVACFMQLWTSLLSLNTTYDSLL